ncbi:hypothetical protein NQZ68_029820 [Dissostichus eleginoides]|nr:hypothetical protein NQZ68_029820 [Dissostichus eleginoides]
MSKTQANPEQDHVARGSPVGSCSGNTSGTLCFGPSDACQVAPQTVLELSAALVQIWEAIPHDTIRTPTGPHSDGDVGCTDFRLGMTE